MMEFLGPIRDRVLANAQVHEGDVLLDGASRRSFSAPAWRRQVVYSAAEPGWWHERVADHFRGEMSEIARGMFLSRRTVQTYISHILAKLGAKSRVEIVREALRHGVAP